MRKIGISVPSVAFLGVISVHSDHDIFMQGIQQSRRLKVSFFCRKRRQHLLRQCAPLHYSKGQVEGDDLDCYFIWDFEASKGSHFLTLPPSQIFTMELTKETFSVGDFSSRREKTAELTNGSHA